MGLNSKYVIAPSLEMYFVDKDSGLPLSNGQVFFYEDEARTIPKPVFQISGAPPNYSYTVLPNPSTLSSVGTFQDDSGNDIIPYYYPYDDNGDIELYYIEVYNEGGVLQFTREGWPNFTAANVTADQDITNFVPNGQFILHNNIPASSANSFVANQVSQAVTTIAQGGWTFERDSMSSATDFVTFPRYGSAVTSPTGNPRYAVQIQTTVAGSDTRKDLCLTFPNVNTFASDSLEYNLYFEAQSATGSAISNIEIIIRKNFGTNGSATTETVVTSISLNNSVQKFNTTLLFGTNENKTIGNLDDDYVQIAIRLPPTGVQNAIFTDFCLTVNNDTLSSFPTQTEAQQISQAVAGWMEGYDYNELDVYLPLVLTPYGMRPDASLIGKIFASVVTKSVGELDCDGTQYRTNDYSSDGIPYSRLGAKLFDTTINAPIFGTGSNYATAVVSDTVTNQLVLSTNKAGLQTGAVDGATSTGFTFKPTVHIGTSGIGITSHANTVSVTGRLNITGSPLAAASIGTTGFTLTQTDITTPATYYSFVFSTPTAAAMVAGTYITFSNTTTSYYMWFTIDGAGADPAPGGTGIQVNLLSNMSAPDVANIVSNTINQTQISCFTTIAASGMTAGAYFTFFANSTQYAVWYEIAGAGTAPALGSSVYYMVVSLAGSETNATVAALTQISINSQFYAVPDLRGVFLRGTDATDIFDNKANRYGFYNYMDGSHVGTFELDLYAQHSHSSAFHGANGSTVPPYGAFVGHNGGPAGGNDTIPSYTINNNGGLETRPVNMYVNWLIKY